MIKVSVMYPKTESSHFDMDYYLKTHMPMVSEKVGDACKQVSVDQGMAGGAPGEAPAFEAMAHMLFESVEAFQASFGPHAKTLMGDIPNFTNVQPSVQISQVIQ